MHALRRTLAAGLLTAAVGCGVNPPAPTPEAAPLSVEGWKALPPDRKYTPETLERLKDGDPKLQTPEGWEAFQKAVVLPARKKDFPNGKTR